jgi:thiamine-phosphate pyrophosphorylase
MTQLAHGYGALLIVNDRLDIAVASGADGAHLGQDDVPVKEARKMAPQNFIIGASVGNIDEALAAEQDGADYVALSPIFSTPSKSDAGPGHGLGVLADIRRSVRVPVIAIGGITPANAASVIKAGADGVAVISAVIGQTDVERAARELKNIVLAAKAGKKRI